MPHRDDRPRCPKCSSPAVGYDVMWDELRCEAGHRWDGPVNGTATVAQVNAIATAGRAK